MRKIHNFVLLTLEHIRLAAQPVFKRACSRRGLYQIGLLAFMAWLALACNTEIAWAYDRIPTDHPSYAGETHADAVLGQVGFDQQLNELLPLDLPLQDEAGRQAPLERYLAGKPAILALSYYECSTLCPLVFEGLEESLQQLNLSIGSDFNVVMVSIDPEETPETAAAKKATYLNRYGRPGAAEGWHFLTAEQDTISQLADDVGFRYVQDSATDQFAHPAGVILLTPQGRISRYLYGIEYSAKDLRLGLVEASANRIGSFADQVLLRCYRYDPITGQYTVAIRTTVQAASLLTILGVGATIVFLRRQEDRRRVPVDES